MSRKSKQRKQTQAAKEETPVPQKAKKIAWPFAPWPLWKKVAFGVSIAVIFLIFFAIFLVCDYSAAKSELAQATQNEITFPETSAMSVQSDGTVLYDGTTYALRDNIYTVLFIGIDRSDERLNNGSDAAVSLADTLVVASIDLETSEMSLITIPRDTMVTIYTHTADGEHNGYLYGQITTQYAYGGGKDQYRCQSTLEAVSRLLNGLTIDAYVTLDMDSIVDITELLDGMPVIVPDDEYYCDYTGYEPGQWVMLDGESALQFVQYRDTDVFASAESRVERQKLFLEAAVNRLYVLFTENPIKAAYVSLRGYLMVNTNVSLMKAALLVPNLLSFDMKTLSMYTVPGEVLDTETYEEYIYDQDALDLLLLALYYQEVPA